MRQYFTMDMRFMADKDMVPGWGDRPEDFIMKLADGFLHSPVYNPSARIVRVRGYGHPDGQPRHFGHLTGLVLTPADYAAQLRLRLGEVA